jgi:hypothetical protein
VSSPLLKARERRTLALGVTVSLLALAFAYVALPFARRWQAREQLIAAESERVAELRGLVSNEQALRTALAERTSQLEAEPQRLLAGRTPALAAASLQSLLQEFADQSRLTVSRLDVVSAPDASAEGLPTIPATVSALGDVYGMTEMLRLIRNAPVRLQLDDFTVRPNPALRGELLQMTLILRAPYVEQ